MRTFVLFLALASAVPAVSLAQSSQADAAARAIDRQTQEILPQVVAWRRDFHQHPELGMQEVRTSKIIADHLRGLGMDVRTGIAGTGVVGILTGAKPGKVVALRADMDGLPVTEQVDVPFKSTAKAMWNGQETGVMHACGHDNHMAILMGTATILARMRNELSGTVKFIFQPAEEGPGGAEPMVKAGIMDDPKVDAVFGLHVFPFTAGTIVYRSGPLMASADEFTIEITGRQTHGAVPWGGVDPIVIGAQIVTSLQSIVSRSVNIAQAPAVVTVGKFAAGNRSNIIPDKAELVGTVRAFDEGERAKIRQRITDIATKYAEAAGATAKVDFGLGYPVTRNDPALTAQMVPTLERVAGPGKAIVGPLTGTAEDFSYFQQEAPGLFFFLGVTPPGQEAGAAQNHSPLFFADESALPVGVRALTSLTVDYLRAQ
ncbi:MAG: amidohydrolase [Acidobacteriota bacterium]|nr:amidohydrolase [Acidobacteriota bacterium]